MSVAGAQVKITLAGLIVPTVAGMPGVVGRLVSMTSVEAEEMGELFRAPSTDVAVIR